MTLKPENISAVNFDVVTVENILGLEETGWTTHAIMVDSGNLRKPPVASQREFVIREARERSSADKGIIMVK